MHGFIWVTDDARFDQVRAGEVLSNPTDRPPWFVVDRCIESITVARWPGRLFRAEILTFAPEQPRPEAHYRRGVSIRVGAEVPPHLLFGDHGESVSAVVDFASDLCREDAIRLGQARDPGASAIYDRVWHRWLEMQPGGGPWRDDEHTHTILVPGVGPWGSPVGAALTLVHDLVWRRAKAEEGDAAFEIDEDNEATLREPWRGAVSALLEAALGRGAQGLADSAELACLAAGLSPFCPRA